MLARTALFCPRGLLAGTRRFSASRDCVDSRFAALSLSDYELVRAPAVMPSCRSFLLETCLCSFHAPACQPQHIEDNLMSPALVVYEEKVRSRRRLFLPFLPPPMRCL